MESLGLGDFEDPHVWNQIAAKYPERIRRIPEAVYQFRSEEEIQLRVDKILPKLDAYAAPGRSMLRSSHLRIWIGVFAPDSADETVEHLETLISDMASDKLLAWSMQASQSTEVIALVKGEAQRTGATTDHKPVQIPNTISKVGDKAMLEQYRADYIK